MAMKRTGIVFGPEDKKNIEAVRKYLEKQGVKVSAAEAVRYALRQFVATTGRAK